MATEIYMDNNAKEVVMQVVLQAFDPTHKKHAAARRVMHYMLSLALTRGYRQGGVLNTYFRGAKQLQSPQMTERLINQLLEFVSADEFAEFVERIRY